MRIRPRSPYEGLTSPRRQPPLDPLIATQAIVSFLSPASPVGIVRVFYTLIWRVTFLYENNETEFLKNACRIFRFLFICSHRALRDSNDLAIALRQWFDRPVVARRAFIDNLEVMVFHHFWTVAHFQSHLSLVLRLLHAVAAETVT